MTIRNGVLVGVLFLAGIPVSMAGTIDASVAPLAGTVSIGSWNNTFDFLTDGSVTDGGGGTFNYTGAFGDANWDFNWALEANADPFIAGALTFTNVTASTQTFNVVLSYRYCKRQGWLMKPASWR